MAPPGWPETRGLAETDRGGGQERRQVSETRRITLSEFSRFVSTSPKK
jgi:hypothetical protein